MLAGWIHGLTGNPLLDDGVLKPTDLIPCTTSNIWTAGPTAGDSTNFKPAASDLDRWARRLIYTAQAAESENVMTDVLLRDGTGESWTVSDQRLLSAFELWFGAPIEQLCAGVCLVSP